MKKMVSCILIFVILVASHGCATLKNTKVPKAFKDVGVCVHCKKLIALDGLADDDTVICPECDTPFIVKDARTGFKRSIAAQKNRKAAKGFLTAAWMAASVAGMIYGIPIPPPMIDSDTFSPYVAPFSISCRKARRAYRPDPYYRETFTISPNSGWSKLPNPYEVEIGPYSLVIDDYEGRPLKKICESSYILMNEQGSIEGKNRPLEIKY